MGWGPTGRISQLCFLQQGLRKTCWESKASHPILHAAGMDPELQDGTGSHHFLPRGEGTVSPTAVDGEELRPTGGKEEWLTLRCCNSAALRRRPGDRQTAPVGLGCGALIAAAIKWFVVWLCLSLGFAERGALPWCRCLVLHPWLSHLEPQTEGQKGAGGTGGHPTVLHHSQLPNLRRGAEQSRGIAQRCLQDAVGSFPTIANRCFQPGLCRGSFAEQEAPCCSSREAKVLCRNPWDTAQCWSEREQANFLGNPQMKTCPFSTEQLRNFGCPPRV